MRGGARPGAGRPLLGPAVKRSRRIVLRVNPAEGDMLDRWADRQGRTLTDLATKTVLEVAKKEHPDG